MKTYPVGIVKVKKPRKTDIWSIRIFICCGIVSMLLFIRWFLNPEHVGYGPIFWLLTFALAFKLLKMLHEWYHYWSPSVPVMPELSKKWTVDILTTACPGEPREMIIRTLHAMKNIRYPHTNYLCDEGNDPVLKQVCEESGIIHVTRQLKNDAKAGNINNALRQATGDICVVLDPDHVPVPEFLDRVLPYFIDESIGFVQCVQAYGNQDESFVAKGAAEQTYHFYGPMMMCMNTYGTVQAIGANCTFRRKALDSIGGHAAGLSEDMHTAMQLHAKGWKSVYIPEILSRGLVPATLSSYYKQQLKWSRGTFELLFRILPKLFKNYTWRQKIHYITLPMYFLFGLINLIDIAVPILALSFAEVPWEVNLLHFGLYFLPLCGLSLLIRMFAQRWLLEEQERGFHLTGGILRMATWWIFLIGFIYTILKIKVPYIPTPKEDEHKNYLKLSIPNILVLFISIILTGYGLTIDWSPYSFAMASYSLTTSAMLGLTIVMSQQKFIREVKSFSYKIPMLPKISRLVGNHARHFQQTAYQILRNGPVMLLIASSMVLLSYSSISLNEKGDLNPARKKLGGFYLGAAEDTRPHLADLTYSLTVISVSQDWSRDCDPFCGDELNNIRYTDAIPFIYWKTENMSINRDQLLSEIKNGQHDEYLKKCAAFFREYKDPVFLTFVEAPGCPSPGSSDQFVLAWQYLYTFFNNLGISNITWVWCPAVPGEEPFYPGEKFVDWIGINVLNYAENQSAKDWYSFKKIYTPFRKRLGKFQKPVMITELGCAAGPYQADWFSSAFNDIYQNFEEVKSVILYGNKKNSRILSGNDPGTYTTDFAVGRKTIMAIAEQESEVQLAKIENSFDSTVVSYSSHFIKGNPGHFQLVVNDKPLYIKGVAYNTAHDWRDGNMPLTRRQIEKDFARIKEMGANTIRRYGTGIYDRNVLNIATEYSLSVLYGFWFDPKTDFYSDAEKVEAYMNEVEKKVSQFKDHSGVIAWCIGNESWGLLKHHYAKPYLTLVRRAYVQMIEQMARRIHRLDPTRPVLTCIEHEEYQLPGELVTLRDNAPSLDVIGINSYYREQIQTLNHIAWQFDSLRPYLVSEFGPSGYWDPKYNKTLNNSVLEESDVEKAKWYKEQWATFVNGYKGYNVGGFAYCWHDRMEGSYTWFGLTDFKGRPKPAYYALKEEWTKIKTPQIPTYSIKGPAAIVPGNEYRFQAIGHFKENTCKYEWRLLKNEYLDQVNNITESDHPASVLVSIPEVPSNYRLYLYVTSQNNTWVTTASIPIKVEASHE